MSQDERTDAEKAEKARLRYQRWFNMAFLGGDLNDLGTRVSRDDAAKILRAAKMKPRRIVA